MKKLNYDELLEGEELEMYCDLTDKLGAEFNTMAEWVLGNGEFFDITVKWVDINLYGEGYSYLGVSVRYTPCDGEFTVISHGKKNIFNDVDTAVEYVKENALKKAV